MRRRASGPPGRAGVAATPPADGQRPAPGDDEAARLALRQLLTVVSDPVLVFDRDAAIEFVNPAAQRALGCGAGDPIDKLAPLLGDMTVRWLRLAIGGLEPVSKLPPARLHGKVATLSWRPLDGGHSALLLVAAAPALPGGEADEAGLRVIWESPFPALLQDSHFRIVDVNAAFSRFIGIERKQLIGCDPVELEPEEDRPATRAQRRQGVAPKGTEAPVERRFIDAQGGERWCRAVSSPLVGSDGRRFDLALMQDTTAEHVARERADRSVRELDDWFVLSPIGMVLYDDDGLLVRTNAAFEALVGVLPVTLGDASEPLRQLLCWGDDASTAVPEPGGDPLVSERWFVRPDGVQRRLRASVRRNRTAGGRFRFMAIVGDRSVEEERDLAQLKIDALMETAGVGLATFQEASGWVHHQVGPSARANPRTLEAASSAALESIGRDIVLPQSLPDYERLQQALHRAERVEVRYAIDHPTLGVRWLLTRVEPATLASGQRTTSVVTLDITEQQQTQARSEQLLREVTTILESSSAGIAYLRGPLLVRCNRRFKAMLGLRGANVEGSSMHELFGHHPQAQQLAAATIGALAEGRRFETEVELPAPDGTRPARWIGVSVRRSGPAESIAVLSDITRLKTQQRELELLARDHELMFSLSEVGIAFVRQGVIRRANHALQVLTGYSADELSAVPPGALFANRETFELFAAQQDEALRLDGRWKGEWQLRRKNGASLWVQVSHRVAVEGDPARGMIAAYVNVDDRHRAEQMVALQAERTRVILDSVLVGIVTVGARGIEWMNRSARRMFGGDLVDFIHLPIATVATPDPDHPFRQTRYLSELAEGEAETFECRLRARDGREFWVVGNAVATGTSGGPQLTYALLDIDRRRQAEAQRSHAQASLQRLIEAAPLAITLRDAATLQVLQVNQTAARSAGRTPLQLVGRTPEQIFGPKIGAERRRDMEQALASTAVTQREYRVARHGTTEVWDARYLPLAAQAGAPPNQLLLVATNVTEQRQAHQAQLEAAIGQREMLVKEVHHRIKNNLQGVVGLMQQIAQRKPEVAGAIGEVVGQVQTIAQVYGLQVGASGPLRVQGVVEAITQSVQRTFGRSVGFTAEGSQVGQWVLPEAESIPIALAYNELLTNAIKHSATDAGVDCRLVADEPGVKLTIANRGRLPGGFDLGRFPGGVSGLGLVQALLPRRSATLSLTQQGERVLAILILRPPAVARSEPARLRET